MLRFQFSDDNGQRSYKDNDTHLPASQCDSSRNVVLVDSRHLHLQTFPLFNMPASSVRILDLPPELLFTIFDHLVPDKWNDTKDKYIGPFPEIAVLLQYRLVCSKSDRHTEL